MKKQFGFKTLIALMLAASALTCIVLLAAAGLYTGAGTGLFGEIRTYIDLRRKINDVYVGDVDGKTVSEAALAATVTALGDRWSYYMTPEQYKDYMEASNNQFSGIGISVRKDEATGGIQVMAVYPGSGAEKAGMAAGDIIIAVNGTDITGMTLKEGSALIQGDIGQTVQLDLIGPEGTRRQVKAEYMLIDTNPVSYEMLDGHVGLIRIKNFEGGASDEFIKAADDLVKQGAVSFVFDVRNNRGGKVVEMQKMLDYLLPECEIFVSVQKNGKETVLRSGPENQKLPAVVLVNQFSFSAAEYFAAVLKEYQYAQVIGQHTTGKNRSQITLELPDGGALHISSGEYLTPKRVSLTEQGGITPDTEVVLSDEDNAALYAEQLDTSKDAQLQKALDVLKQG
jgi:carboxyl-terminal processing protease